MFQLSVAIYFKTLFAAVSHTHTHTRTHTHTHTYVNSYWLACFASFFMIYSQVLNNRASLALFFSLINDFFYNKVIATRVIPNCPTHNTKSKCLGLRRSRYLRQTTLCYHRFVLRTVVVLVVVIICAFYVH